MTPGEIQNKTFERRMGGYKVEEVASYLAEVAAYAQDLADEKEELEKKMTVLAEKLEEYREDEESLRAALIGAQKLGDSVVRDAKKKAEMMLSEASAKADEIINDAKSNIDKEAVALTRMQGKVAEFKSQVLAMYKKHVEMINEIPDDLAVERDVKSIVSSAAEEKIVQRKLEKNSSFVLEYSADDVEGPEEGNPEPGVIPFDRAAQKHKRSDYGNLRFGEEYNLTRKD